MLKKHRVVDHPWRLCFTERTIVESLAPQLENFPALAYYVLRFSQIGKHVRQNILMPG